MPEKSTRDLIKLPDDPSITKAPQIIRLSEWQRQRAAAVKRTKRRVAIMSTLATGWLPWGVEWFTALTRHRRSFILCCGHVMGVKEAQHFVDHGLLTIGADQFDRDGLVITDAGRSWLQWNW